MLILKRLLGERIFIGPNIVVEVLAIEGRNKVELGITAPRSMLVVREEVTVPTKEAKAHGTA